MRRFLVLVGSGCVSDDIFSWVSFIADFSIFIVILVVTLKFFMSIAGFSGSVCSSFSSNLSSVYFPHSL